MSGMRTEAKMLLCLFLFTGFWIAPVASQFTLTQSNAQTPTPAVTVGSSTSGGSTEFDYQSQVFSANGLYWVFYFDGANYGYRTSPDGSTWSSEKIISTAIIKAQGDISYTISGTTIFYAGGKNSADKHFYYRYGTLSHDGSISWSISETPVATTYGSDKFPSISLDSNGNIWVSVNTWSKMNFIEVYEHTTSWSRRLLLSPNGGGLSELVALTSGKMALLYQGVSVKTWDGSTWSGPVTTASNYRFPADAAVAIGDNVELAATDNSNVYYLTFAYGSSSWSVGGFQQTGNYAAISTDGNSNLVLFYSSGNAISFVDSADGGTTWSSPQIISSTEVNPTFLTASVEIASNVAEVGWTSGTSSPFNIRFSTVMLSPSPQVTQPISLSIVPAPASVASFSVSGCNASPNSIVGDGSTVDISANANCVLSVNAPSPSGTDRYVFSGGSASQLVTTCSTGTCGTDSFAYFHQYSVTFVANPTSGGTISPASNWFNDSSTVSIAATQNNGFSFTDWTSSNTSITLISSTSPATSVKVGGSGTVTAFFASTSIFAATVTNKGGTGLTDQRKTFYADGLYWVFFCDGVNLGYVTSSNGANWNNEVSLGLSCNSSQRLSLTLSGNTLYYVRVATSTVDNHFWCRNGTLSTDGTIGWSNEARITTSYDTVDIPNITIDGSGNIWVVVASIDQSTSIHYMEVWEHTTSWKQVDKINVGSLKSSGTILVANSGVVLIYGNTVGYVLASTSSDGGNSWSSPVATGSSSYAFSDSEGVIVGNTVYLATTDRTNVYFLTYTFGSSSWSQPVTIATGRGATLSTDGVSNLILAYHVSNTTVDYVTSTTLGSFWNSAVSLSTNEDGVHDNIGASYSIVGGVVPVIWTVGTSSPFGIRVELARMPS